MYLHWKEQTIHDFSPDNITALYHEGYVFTRLGRGVMHQTRSLRVDLEKFELTSENRRILRKNSELKIKNLELPLRNYDWKIAKLAKDFYDTKFGRGTFSANKIKEILTDPSKSNFNTLLYYKFLPLSAGGGSAFGGVGGGEEGVIGYAICYKNNQILHYAYPFYDLLPHTSNLKPNIGMSMMLGAILYAKEQGLHYVYLGSASRPTDIYKLQFKELEWFYGEAWKSDLNELKNILHSEF